MKRKKQIKAIIVIFIFILIEIGVLVLLKTNTTKPTPLEYTIGEQTSSANDFNDESKNKTLEEWQEINPEVTFLLKINNREIPVLFGQSQDYYLNHNVYGNYDIFGSTSLDENSSLDSEVYVIYGHSTYKKDLVMTFIKDYKNTDFYNEHQTFILEDGVKEHTYKIKAMYLMNDASTDSFKSWCIPSTGSDFNHQTYFNEFIKNAQYVYDTSNNNKRFVVMVTCDMTQDNARYILLAQEQ